jgi:RNA-directed DNA polymerase
MSRLIELFVAETGMDRHDILRIIRTAPDRYKVFEIAKRSGGMREIAQPARELKQLQRVIVQSLLSRLPIHSAATAYRKGLSLLDNALPHAGAGPILKMDFENFFPSIRSEDWLLYCAENGVLDEADRRISAQVLFRRAKGQHVLRLSVGAPSSPLLSNVLMVGFDSAIQEEAVRRGIAYTRYADDLTFSGQRAGMLKDMIKEVGKITRRIDRPKLFINEKKTTFVTAAVQRKVTGVVLANNGKVGIGKEHRRLISVQVHHAIQGKIKGEDLRVLAGDLAFVNSIEPGYMEKLILKYGIENITAIKSLKI